MKITTRPSAAVLVAHGNGLTAILGINKQLDLQIWFSEVRQDMALKQGWHSRRRSVQVVFGAWLILVALPAREWLTKHLVNLDRHAQRAGGSLLLLMLFVVVRAASAQHIYRLLGMSLQGLHLNAILELNGIAPIAIAAIGRRNVPDGKR